MYDFNQAFNFVEIKAILDTTDGLGFISQTETLAIFSQQNTGIKLALEKSLEEIKRLNILVKSQQRKIDASSLEECVAKMVEDLFKKGRIPFPDTVKKITKGLIEVICEARDVKISFGEVSLVVKFKAPSFEEDMIFAFKFAPYSNDSYKGFSLLYETINPQSEEGADAKVLIPFKEGSTDNSS